MVKLSVVIITYYSFLKYLKLSERRQLLRND